VQKTHRLEEILEVKQRLAHTHEDDMRDTLLGQPLEHQILSNNLASSQVPVEPAETSRAECATHWATNLAAEAARDSPFIGEQDALVNLMITIVD
jgi:hypothetical protein